MEQGDKGWSDNIKDIFVYSFDLRNYVNILYIKIF